MNTMTHKYKIGQEVYLINHHYFNDFHGNFCFKSIITDIYCYQNKEGEVSVNYRLKDIDYQHEEKYITTDLTEVIAIITEKLNKKIEKEHEEIEIKKKEILDNIEMELIKMKEN